jgi:SAM-dependent methyltransferase
MSETGHLLPALFAAEHMAGWHSGMRAVSHSLLEGVPVEPGAILEIGSGGGVFAAELAARHPHDRVIAADLSASAVAYGQEQAPAATWVQADLHRLPFPAAGLQLIVALDVLDQRAVAVAAALAEIRRVLQPGGWLLLRVSAYPWLHGAHDDAFNTGRRYGRGELVRRVQEAGLDVRRVTFANTLLAPPVIALRLLQGRGILPFQPAVYTNGLTNRALGVALRLESAWLRAHNLPFGVSLSLLAQRL